MCTDGQDPEHGPMLAYCGAVTDVASRFTSVVLFRKPVSEGSMAFRADHQLGMFLPIRLSLSQKALLVIRCGRIASKLRE